jgi:hypothetical protein
MKSPDTVFAEQFSKYELWKYSRCRKQAEEAKLERNLVVEGLYEDCVPATSYYEESLDKWLKTGTSTEDMALSIIEVKEEYDLKIKRLDNKAEMFELAMDSLTDRQRDVINIFYFDYKNDIGLSEVYFEEILKEAQDKMCSYILEAKKLKQLRTKQERKEVLKKQIAEFKGHRVHIS